MKGRGKMLREGVERTPNGEANSGYFLHFVQGPAYRSPASILNAMRLNPQKQPSSMKKKGNGHRMWSCRVPLASATHHRRLDV